MYKLSFINLTNISSEISLYLLNKDINPIRLNNITVKIYHLLYKKEK